MVNKALITVLVLCLIQSVLTLGSLTPSAAFRANMQQRQRSPNTLFYMDEAPSRQNVDEIKEPIYKRFKPCYYSPIQCLIKKK
ncbi:hypothetical protein CRE_17160 [Caenorhabditis remanei]|uniref:Uncharacterized protein n=1 Tax=Caenorhabditis remanei TaxID=31234 RepID=E3MAG2_CAERE|nr:hypothetical protein CRE_17160 [Caenorhabditis remanei]